MTIYSVQAGNTLSGIAKANNMSLKQLLDLNPELKSNPNLIKVGQKIKLDKDSSIFPSRKNLASQKTQVQQSEVKQPSIKKPQTQRTQTKHQSTQAGKKQEKPLSYGKFYSGMTAEEAKKKGLYEKSFWKFDFQEIDANKDGKISDKEMLEFRDKEAKGNKYAGYLNLGFTFGAYGSNLVYDARKIEKENAQYRKQHNIKD